jgi:hypothetical protein
MEEMQMKQEVRKAKEKGIKPPTCKGVVKKQHFQIRIPKNRQFMMVGK